MPRSLFADIWALNPWAAEPERDAALAPSLRSVLVPPEPLVVAPPGPPPTQPRTWLPETTYDTEDWFRSLVRHWEPKAPVIPPELHVDHSMNVEVGQFVNRHVAEGGVKREKLHCFDYANYQLHRAGFMTGGRPSSDPHSLQVLIEYPEAGELVEEVQVSETLEAVHYIREALHQGTPVLVGICIKTYSPRPNNVKSTPFVEPTNHFVVIVGMDKDEKGVYFRYYDYYFQPVSEAEKTRLYLMPTLKLEWLYSGVMLAEVRRSAPR